MGKLGFFDVLGDSDLSWREARAINQASDRADAALEQGTMLGQSIGALQRRVQVQAHEIDKLRTALAVLAQVLSDAGVVDAKVLDYRLEAAFEEAEAQASEQQAGRTEMCVGCSQPFPVSRLNVTEMGNMCDTCVSRR
jgi:hypothetical protein